MWDGSVWADMKRVSQAHLDLLHEYAKEQKRIKVEQPQETPEPEAPSPGHTPSYAGQAAFSDEEWDEVDLEPEDEFEDVDLDPPAASSGPVEISFAAPKKKESIPRSFKLQVHASCLALLFCHTRTRNFWTQSPAVARALVDQMPSIFLQQLVPPSHLSNTLKTRSLLSGLRQAANWWSQGFSAQKTGLYCVGWADFANKERNVCGEMSLDDFVASIVQRTGGSRDELAQGFCALLRAHKLECRLVCSLQPPDFNSSKSSSATAQSPPIYWTEVWDPFGEQWITVDPITSTVEVTRHASALEPLQSDSRNIMRYVIAWSRDGYCRDVTRRYASKYNARTRKRRLDYFPRYRDFYNKLLARFARYETRDLAELRQFAKWERNEGMPQRIQDFVGHPFYALEHQLKKVEILDPKTPCGTFKIGDEVVPVYPRRHVQTCRSAQTWYRMGRTLKIQSGQPRLHRQKKNRMGEEERVALYSEDQTELYVPPPVEDGVVPKSEYRTIDLFAPTMMPRGAVQIRHPLAQRAAKALGADYANAVVGVNFDRTGPKSKYDGIVVAREVRPGIVAAILELKRLSRYEAKVEARQRTLYLWKQVFVAAQIRRRIDGDVEMPNEEWPTLVPKYVDEVSESEVSEDEEPRAAQSVQSAAPANDQGAGAAVKLEDPESAVGQGSALSNTQSSNQGPSTQKTKASLQDLIHHREPISAELPAKPVPPESDSEEHDVFLDGLNESDFDI